VPDFTKAYIEEIRQLALELSAEELRAEIAAAKETIEAIQDRYDVESREELEESLADPDISAEETRTRSRALRDWEEESDAITLLKHALSLQDDLLDVDPYAEVERDSRGSDERRRGEAD
jgi:PAB1-binding protein PBP1